MKKALLLALFLSTPLLSMPLKADEPKGFGMWRTSDLLSLDGVLAMHSGPDHSATNTLADYGNHSLQMLYRDGNGRPEEHDNIADVIIVQTGEGVLQLGGTLSDRRSTTPGEYVGTALEGGQRYPLGPGDIVHVPAGVPHAFLVPDGRHLTYVLVKIPSK